MLSVCGVVRLRQGAFDEISDQYRRSSAEDQLEGSGSGRFWKVRNEYKVQCANASKPYENSSTYFQYIVWYISAKSVK